MANVRAARPPRPQDEKMNSASIEDIGRKGPQFLTMTRADFAAYEYLCRVSEARAWIEEIIKEKLDDDFWKALADGTVLCKLVNFMWPGTIPKYNGANSYRFKLIENISMFLKAVEAHGIGPQDSFQPIDLFEKKNMPLVLNCLHKLAELVQKQGFTVIWKNKQNADFSPKEIQEAKKLEGVNLWQKKASTSSTDLVNKKKSSLSESEIVEAEVRKQQEEQEKEILRKQEEQEHERQRKLEEEEQRKKAEENENKIKKEEEERKRLNEEELIKVARIQKQKDLENQLIKKREDEERKRKEEEELEFLRKKKEEEELESRREKRFGGKEKLDRIRNMLGDLEKLLNPEDKNTVLHLAAEKNMNEIVDYLVEEKHENSNAVNANNEIPLHLAVKKGNEDLLNSLIKCGSDINAVDRDGNCPIHIASANGNDIAVSKLIDAGADINARNLSLDTPLIIACKDEHINVVDVLIKKPLNVNASNKERETALHIVSEKGNISLVNQLFSTGKLDLNSRNKDHATPLQLAAENQHFELVKRLVELGAELNTRRNDGWTPLYTAAYNGDITTSVYLLSKGADVNGTNEEGWTPLHAACAQGHTKLVKSFVEDFNASINILNEQGTTPLFHAVSAGRRAIAEFLIEKGADVDLAKENYWRPIHAATYNEFEKLTTLLVEKNAALNLPCQEIKGYTPLHILISTEEAPMKLIELLVKNGAGLNIPNSTGGTPLHLAVFWGHFEVVKFLVEEGAKMDVKNEKGRTPLDISGLYGHKAIAEYLSEKSGKPIPKMKEKVRKTSMMKSPAEPPTPNVK